MQDGSARQEQTLLLVLLACVGLPDSARADELEQPMEKVTILGDRSPLYRSDDVQLGPLADRPLVDTPYAVDVVPANLSINQQLKSVREVFRYMPSVQGENIRPQTRGLHGYGQPYGGDDNVTRTFSGRLKYDLNSDWHVAAGILQQDSDRASTVPTQLASDFARSQVRERGAPAGDRSPRRLRVVSFEQ